MKVVTRIRDIAGHYTQLVWRGSEQLGIGLARTIDANGVSYYVVCNYYPPGNIMGQFATNVFVSQSSSFKDFDANSERIKLMLLFVLYLNLKLTKILS